MTPEEENLLLHRIAFSQVAQMRPSLAEQILERCADEQTFFALGEAELASLLGFRNRIVERAYRDGLLEKARSEMLFLRSNAVTPLYFTDPAYPRRLLQADDAPLMLYATGRADLNARHVVGVVGTRSATRYGAEFVDALVGELAERLDGLLVVSGLALGCDGAAHRAALKASVPTAGVVAHGLDTLYPPENRPLATQMVRSGGSVLTEYLHGSRPFRGNFLARNRIIAGMCDCLVVAESGSKGGALYTAYLAMGYNRDVFALPGRISDPYSRGTNDLIRRHRAALLTCASDLMEAMNWEGRPAREGAQQPLFAALTAEQQQVVDYLRHNGDCQLNRISLDTGLPIARLSSLMIELDFAGAVTLLPGARYRLKIDNRE